MNPALIESAMATDGYGMSSAGPGGNNGQNSWMNALKGGLQGLQQGQGQDQGQGQSNDRLQKLLSLLRMGEQPQDQTQMFNPNGGM